MVSAEQVSWTITGASDYPMMVQMMTWAAAIFVVVFGGCFSIIIGLIVYTWYDLKNRICTQRKEDHESCGQCKQSSTREMDAIWDNIYACCKASGVTPLTKKDVAVL